MILDRRNFLKLAGGAVAFATLPKVLSGPVDDLDLIMEGANTVTVTVSGLESGDHVYAYVVDDDGNPIDDVYEATRYITRNSDKRALLEIPSKHSGRSIQFVTRRTAKQYEIFPGRTITPERVFTEKFA